jgi:hypothetical protein
VSLAVPLDKDCGQNESASVQRKTDVLKLQIEEVRTEYAAGNVAAHHPEAESM